MASDSQNTTTLKLGDFLGSGTYSNVYELGDRFAMKNPKTRDNLFVSEMEYFVALAARSLSPRIYSIDFSRHIVVVEKMFPLIHALWFHRVETVVYSLLDLMVSLAKCGVVCFDMKTENVAVAYGQSTVYLIDPGLYLTGFQNETYDAECDADDDIQYAFVVGMLKNFIAASYDSATLKCKKSVSLQPVPVTVARILQNYEIHLCIS
jgi:hypothetical protein